MSSPTPTETPTVTPTPTTTVSPTNTKTQTPTPSITITQTPTITQTTTPLPTRTILPTTTPTQSITRTNTPTRTQTPTITPTMTSTPGISVHLISRNRFTDYYDSCKDVMTTSSFYTYISQANLIPVVGIKIYSTSVDGLLYNPVNGRNAWYKSKWGNDLYSVKIDNYGTILDFIICS